MRVLSIPCAIALALLTTGCAQMVRDEALGKLRVGQYEEAIQLFQDGVARYPDSTMLRAGLVAARAEAISRWSGEATQMRMAGRLEDAEQILQRALRSEPQNERLQAQLEDVAAERRVQQRLDAAGKLAAAGQKAQAAR